MGMNTILTIIAGIVMTTMVGTQVAPSIIDQIKVKKTQVQTILSLKQLKDTQQ